MEATRLRVRQIICGCKSSDIEPLVSRWEILQNGDVNFTKSKKEIHEDVLSHCQTRKHFKNEVDELDLMYTQTYPKKKLWRVFHLEDKGDITRGKMDLSNPVKFKKKFRSQVELYFNDATSINVGVYNGALWTRLYVASVANGRQDATYRPGNCVYMVYFPKTEYVIISRYKQSMEEFLHRCILNTMGVSKMTNMQLSGHDLNSLIQLALRRDCQGSFSRFSSVQGFQPEKRKVTEIERDENVFCEDEETKKKRAKILETSFGREIQPCLEKVEYRTKTKFKGFTQSMAGKDFQCTVKFEGSNVLEGIRNLGTTGLAKVPLPSHLSAIPSCAKNLIVLKDKTQET